MLKQSAVQNELFDSLDKHVFFASSDSSLSTTRSSEVICYVTGVNTEGLFFFFFEYIKSPKNNENAQRLEGWVTNQIYSFFININFFFFKRANHHIWESFGSDDFNNYKVELSSLDQILHCVLWC